MKRTRMRCFVSEESRQSIVVGTLVVMLAAALAAADERRAKDPLSASAPASAPAVRSHLHMSWKKDVLTLVSPRLPGGPLEVWYLEAFCRRGSTDRDWYQTIIPFHTELTGADPDGAWLTLYSVVDGKVEVK